MPTQHLLLSAGSVSLPILLKTVRIGEDMCSAMAVLLAVTSLSEVVETTDTGTGILKRCRWDASKCRAV